jgi:hypothetical protein
MKTGNLGLKELKNWSNYQTALFKKRDYLTYRLMKKTQSKGSKDYNSKGKETLLIEEYMQIVVRCVAT